MKYLFSIFIALFFIGCLPANYQNALDITTTNQTNTQKHIFRSLDSAIISLAKQLFDSSIQIENSPKIVLTSFVELEQLNHTTAFGRIVGESMFNELYTRGFKVADIRGQDAISINADGEFHITRDVRKLKKHISGINYILVGTYANFDNNSIALNARILDSVSGELISSSRVIYIPKDCSVFDLCKKDTNKQYSRGINIVTDYCSQVGCPDQSCKSGTCDNSYLY